MHLTAKDRGLLLIRQNCPARFGIEKFINDWNQAVLR